MGSFLSRKARLITMIAGSCMLIALFCAKKESTPTGENPGTSKTVQPPTITLISPAADTSVPGVDSQIVISGIVTDPSNIANKFMINGADYAASLKADKTFQITMPLSTVSDTTTFAFQYYSDAAENYVARDTVSVFKVRVVAKGLAKVTGTLYAEASASSAKRRLGKSAAGQELVVNALPASGADILIYDANAVSTSSTASAKTDSLGQWSVEIEPGSYFIFAVYFDRENLRMITTSLPDIQAKQDEEVTTDTATAISDEIAPMLSTFLDAINPDSTNTFLSSGLPQGAPIVLAFSEPMTRSSGGDSLKGIMLYEVLGDSSGLPIVDSIPCIKKWAPSGKELRLVPTQTLTIDKTYKVVIPTSVKDLALNKLDATYYGVFTVIAVTSLPDFAVNTTSPVYEGDSIETIGPLFPVEFTFSRPVDALSLNQNYTITPAIKGYFEARGQIARFVNSAAWARESTYTLIIKAGVKDLLVGDSLGVQDTLKFTISKPDSFETKTDPSGAAASFFKGILDAYQGGDLETFSRGFHINFEFVQFDRRRQWDSVTNQEITTNTEERMTKDQFLQMIRDGNADEQRMAQGFYSPVWYFIKKGTMPDYTQCWKLTKNSTSVYFQDMGGSVGFGMRPRVFKVSDSSEITSAVVFKERSIVYNNDTLVFAPLMNTATMGSNLRDNDPSYFGKMLQEQTNVTLQTIKMINKESFNVKTVQPVTGETGAYIVMVEMLGERSFVDNKVPWPVMPGSTQPAVEKWIQSMQAKVTTEVGRLFCVQMVVKPVWNNMDGQSSTPPVVNDSMYTIQTITQTPAVEIVAPVNKAVNVAAPIVLKWNKVPNQAELKGYLVAITDSKSGGMSGLLIYSRDTSVTISESGQVTGGDIVNISPEKLGVPLPYFSMRLAALNKDAIYVWKVVGLPDTSVNEIIAKGGIRVIADSDFGRTRGLALFTMAASMPDINVSMPAQNQPGTTINQFMDSDGDMFPDWIEKALLTNAYDNGSWPNFGIDSDHDGYPDFMEKVAGSNPESDSSKPVDILGGKQNMIADTLEKIAGWDPRLAKDDDADGFPTEIEYIYRTDPWNNNSKPSTTVKAQTPVGTFMGLFRAQQTSTAAMIPDSMLPQIQFTLFTTNGKDSVSIDTTTIEGVASGQKSPLLYNFSEWVFFAKVSSGPAGGKFLKLRGMYNGYNQFRGPVDLADQVGGGGPYVGEFIASTDGNVSFSGPNPGMTPGPGPGTGTNGYVDPNRIQAPPMGMGIRPFNGRDMKVNIEADSLGMISLLKLIWKDTTGMLDTLVANPGTARWQPGMYPSLSANFTKGSKELKLECMMFKTADSLFLAGQVRTFENGMMSELNDYTIILAGYTNIRNPSGMWEGWVMLNQGATNPNPGMPGTPGTGWDSTVQPRPYIGMRDVVTKAVTLAANKGVSWTSPMSAITAADIKTISAPFQSPRYGNMWVTVEAASGDTVPILENPMNNTQVLVDTIEGTLVVVFGKFQMNTGATSGPIPFRGTEADARAALTSTGNQGIIPGTQNAHTLSNLFQDPAGQWTVRDSFTNETFAILAKDGNPNVVMIVTDPQGTPYVALMMLGGGPGPVNPPDTSWNNPPMTFGTPVFSGPMDSVTKYLNNSGEVYLADSVGVIVSETMIRVGLNLRSIMLNNSPVVICNGVAQDSLTEYIFLASSFGTDTKVLRQYGAGRPVVMALPRKNATHTPPDTGYQQPINPPSDTSKPQVYTGGLLTIQTILNGSTQVYLAGNGATPMLFNFLPGSLQMVPNGQGGEVAICKDMNNVQSFVFLATATDMKTLYLFNGKPVIMSASTAP